MNAGDLAPRRSGNVQQRKLPPVFGALSNFSEITRSPISCKASLTLPAE